MDRTAHSKRDVAMSLWLLMIVLTLCFTTACAPTYTDYNAFIKYPIKPVAATEYRMSPPDVITIRSKRVREVNGHTEQIRADGRVSLPLIGSIYIAGMTPEEASAELEAMAREYYSDADIALRVVGYNSKKVFVFGEVNRPGPYPFTGENTVLNTMARAQPNRLADPAKVQVLRPNHDGQLIRRMTVDLNRMIEGGDLTMNALLEENDIIYVPPTPAAEIGLALQHLLIPVQPAASLAGSVPTVYAETQRAPYGEGDGNE